MSETTLAATANSPLTLEYALKSPGYSRSQGWSGYSRRVAIAFLQGSFLNAHSTIYTLEVASRLLNGPYAHGHPAEHVALSFDGSLVVATKPREARVYAWDQFTLLAHAKAPLPDCYFRGAPAISQDSASVWVPCSWLQNLRPGETGLGALRYQLPELTLRGRVTVAERANNTVQSRPIVRSDDRRPILAGVIRRWQDIDPSSKAGKSFIYCSDLNDNKPCFKTFELVHRSNIRGVFQLSTSLSLAAVSADRPGEALLAASCVDIYDTASGSLVATILVPVPIRSGIPTALEFLSAGKYLAAAFDASKQSKGGMAVWDLRTGELLQTIQRGPVRQMSVSPEGGRLLALTDQEILMFRITP